MDLIEYVGQKIRELRENYDNGRGISQQALAEALAAAPNTVSRWETGVYKPSLKDLDKLSRFFGVSVLQFFPQAEQTGNEGMRALMRAAEGLREDDLEELRRYAEFRKARAIYGDAGRPRPGRKRKTDE
jgi:transcriptional regulator with XRE-family HTH domain